MALQWYADQSCPQWDVDPFDINDLCKEPMNFATGMLAIHEIKKNFIECIVKGKKSVEKLIKERLMPAGDKEEAAKSCFVPIL